jgi:hypothetical protein
MVNKLLAELLRLAKSGIKLALLPAATLAKMTRKIEAKESEMSRLLSLMKRAARKKMIAKAMKRKR